jgi:putative transposase
MRVIDPTSGREFFSKRRRRFDEERMPRELTFSCYQRLPLLNRDRSRQWFVEALNEARTHWPIDLWAWVIMPEHVHLLIAPREGKVPVGKFQGEIKERTARPAIAWLELNAPRWLSRITVREGSRVRRRFWQPGGGYDRNIDHYDTLLASINYFHLNPVKRGLVERPEDWPWSSAGWYAGIRPPLIEMDATLPAP